MTPVSDAEVRSSPSVADTRAVMSWTVSSGSHAARAFSVRPTTLRSTRPARATGPVAPLWSNCRGMAAVPVMAPPCHCAVSDSTASIEPSKVAAAMSASIGGMPARATEPLASAMVERVVAMLPRLSHSAVRAPVAVVPSGTAPNARARATTSASSPVNAARSGSSRPSRKRPPRVR